MKRSTFHSIVILSGYFSALALFAGALAWDTPPAIVAPNMIVIVAATWAYAVWGTKS